MDNLKELAKKLRDMADACDRVAKLPMVVDTNEPLQDIAEFIAMMASDGKITPLREWFCDLEIETVRILIVAGLKSRDMGKILGCSPDSVRQYVMLKGLTFQTKDGRKKS